MSRQSKSSRRKKRPNLRYNYSTKADVTSHYDSAESFTGGCVSKRSVAYLNHLIDTNGSIPPQLLAESIKCVVSGSQDVNFAEKLHACLFIQCLECVTGKYLPMTLDVPQLVPVIKDVSTYWGVCDLMRWGQYLLRCVMLVPQEEGRDVIRILLQPSVMRHKHLVEGLLASLCQGHILQGCKNHVPALIHVSECVSEMFVFPVHSVQQFGHVKLRYSTDTETVSVILASIHALLTFCHLHMSASGQTNKGAESPREVETIISRLPHEFITSECVRSILVEDSDGESDAMPSLCKLLPDLSSVVTLLRSMWTIFLSIQHGHIKEPTYSSLHDHLSLDVTLSRRFLTTPSHSAADTQLTTLRTLVEDIAAFLRSIHVTPTAAVPKHEELINEMSVDEKVFRVEHDLRGSYACLECLCCDERYVVGSSPADAHVVDVISQGVRRLADTDLFIKLLHTLLNLGSHSDSCHVNYVALAQSACQHFSLLPDSDKAHVISKLHSMGHKLVDVSCGQCPQWLVLADYDSRFQLEINSLTDIDNLSYLMLQSPGRILLTVLERGLVSEIYCKFALDLLAKYKEILALSIDGSNRRHVLQVHNVMEFCLFRALNEMEVDDDNVDDTVRIMMRLLTSSVDAALTNWDTCVRVAVGNICCEKVTGKHSSAVIMKHVLIIKCIRAMIDSPQSISAPVLSSLLENVVEMYKSYIDACIRNKQHLLVRETIHELFIQVRRVVTKQSQVEATTKQNEVEATTKQMSTKLDPFHCLLHSSLILDVREMVSDHSFWCNLLITGAVNESIQLSVNEPLHVGFNGLVTALTLVLPGLIVVEWRNLVGNMLDWFKSGLIECQCQLSDYTKLVGVMPSLQSLPYLTLISLITNATRLVMLSNVNVDKQQYFAQLVEISKHSISTNPDNGCRSAMLDIISYFIQIYSYHPKCIVDIALYLLQLVRSHSPFKTQCFSSVITKYVSESDDMKKLMLPLAEM